MQVIVSNVQVQVDGSMAWVVDVEQVTSTFETGFSTAWVQPLVGFARSNLVMALDQRLQRSLIRCGLGHGVRSQSGKQYRCRKGEETVQ